jgi:hypothetical protein
MARIKTSFVNNARNQVLLAGVYRRINGEHFLLQSNNLAAAIPLNPSKWATMPGDGELIQLSGHIRGLAHPDAKRQTLSVDVFHLKRPSLGTVPRQHALMGSVKGGEGRAIDSFGQIKQRLQDEFEMEAEVVQYLMKDQGQNQNGGFLNRVFLSGFVGSKAFIPPSLEGDTDGYIAFNLLQFPDQERGIPVRVQRVNQAFGKMLMKGQPINVVASIAVENRNVEGAEQPQRLAYLRTTRDTVSMALASDFEGKTFPAWWREMLQAELQARAAAPQAGSATPRAYTPAPAPALAAAPVLEGVTHSGEEI